MTTAITLIICLGLQAPTPSAMPVAGATQGIAKYYSASYGNWSRIAARNGVKLCPDCDAFAARPSCKTLGQVFWAKIGNRTYKLTQADCAQARHYQGQIRSGLVLEVPYWIAKEVGMVRTGRAEAQVWEAR